MGGFYILLGVCFLLSLLSCGTSVRASNSGAISPEGQNGIFWAENEQPCNASVLCNPYAFLSCNEATGICGCLAPQSEFHQKDGMCKVRLDEECKEGNVEMPCFDQFSFCSKFSGKLKCECSNNYVGYDGQCFLPRWEKCSNATDPPTFPTCNTEAHLECLQLSSSTSVCNCKNENDEGYQEETKSCVMLEGTTCTPGGQPCVDKAECIERIPGRSNYTCTCADGYEADASTRRCVTYYGQGCGHAGNATCRAEAFLECMNGACACDPTDPDVAYDATQETCALLPGSKCGDESTYDCMHLSECNSEGICECIEPLSPGKNKHCSIPYGEMCDYSPSGRWNCDSSSNFKCTYRANTCGCDSLSILQDGVCRIKAGEWCSWDCVQNAQCNSTAQECVCNSPDFVATKNGTCARSYNATCAMGASPDECNVDGGQKCTNGHCACADPTTMIYNVTLAQCFLKSGASCAVDGFPCNNPLSCGNTTKICECNATLGLLPDGSGSCFKSFGMDCGRGSKYPEIDCDPRADLLCSSYNDCRCNSSITTAYTNGSVTLCLKKIGVSCNAAESYKGRCNHHDNLDCVDGACACDSSIASEYISGGNFVQCLKKMGVSCDVAESYKGGCNIGDYLDCIDGACACDSRHYQYDQEMICVGDANAPCRDGRHCNPDKGLTCDPYYFQCGCNRTEDFLSDGHGGCVKKLDTKCDYDSGPEGFCDPEDSLSCSIDEGKCVCDKNTTLVYSECLKILGVTCDINVGIEGRCNRDDCLVCDGGVCACDTEHEPNKDLTACAGGLDAPCSSNKHCKAEQLLQCNLYRGKCERTPVSAGARFYLNFRHATFVLVPLIVRSFVFN